MSQSTAWRLPRRAESLADYIGAARKARKLTFDELVRRTGLSLSTLRKIEDGSTENPGLFTLLPIWNAMELPHEALVRVRRASTASTPSRVD